MSLRRLARHWNAFASRDPMWAILTWPEKRGNRWDEAEFFATGRVEVEAALAAARAVRGPLAGGRALDFGCGIGRLTRALGAHFAEVHGVDIAAAMVERARRLVPEATFHCHTAPDLALFPAEHFALVYSSLTLQHVAPRFTRAYLREFARVLAPDGLLVFQLAESPRRRPNRNRLVHRAGRLLAGALRAARVRWRLLVRGEPSMDMHGMPRDEVERVLAASGCRLVLVEENDAAGAHWTSCRYFAVRAPG